MIENPPVDPMAEQGQVSIAWPLDTLVDGGAKPAFRGFLMPLIRDMNPIIDFYHPKTRRQKHALFNYHYLLRAARNLAACVGALHARGYVIGDLNESNILVSDTALVALVDTDSFQVTDTATKRVHRCTVGKVEFTPRELQGVNFSQVDRSQEHDCFGLAVLIFQLLMEGIHPFAGDTLVTVSRRRLNNALSPGGTRSSGPSCPTLPVPTAPHSEIMDPGLRELFKICFVQGHERPSSRPTAHLWQQALLRAEGALLLCTANTQHLYGSHLSSCPWCKRARQLKGFDTFPSREAVNQRAHLRSPQTRRASPTVQEGITYEEAIALAVAAAVRKKFLQRLCLIGVVAFGLALIVYWAIAFRFWL